MTLVSGKFYSSLHHCRPAEAEPAMKDAEGHQFRRSLERDERQDKLVRWR